MNRSGWKWTLAGAVVFALLTVMAFISYNYEMFRKWPLYLGLAVAFGGVTFFLYRSGAENAAAEQARRKAGEEAARKDQEEKEARRKADAWRFRRESFAVAGVTFKNEDGSDRQKILREIVLNEMGFCDVWFDQDPELGEESGISVQTDLGCVGFIRRSDKEKVRRFFNKKINSSTLHAELFENEDGEKIYRADVVFGMDRNDPEQAWYFDGLQ